MMRTAALFHAQHVLQQRLSLLGTSIAAWPPDPDAKCVPRAWRPQRSIDQRAWRAGTQTPLPTACASYRYALDNDMTLDEVLERTVVADFYFQDVDHATREQVCRGIDCVGTDKVHL